MPKEAADKNGPLVEDADEGEEEEAVSVLATDEAVVVEAAAVDETAATAAGVAEGTFVLTDEFVEDREEVALLLLPPDKRCWATS